MTIYDKIAILENMRSLVNENTPCGITEGIIKLLTDAETEKKKSVVKASGTASLQRLIDKWQKTSTYKNVKTDIVYRIKPYNGNISSLKSIPHKQTDGKPESPKQAIQKATKQDGQSRQGVDKSSTPEKHIGNYLLF